MAHESTEGLRKVERRFWQVGRPPGSIAGASVFILGARSDDDDYDEYEDGMMMVVLVMVMMMIVMMMVMMLMMTMLLMLLVILVISMMMTWCNSITGCKLGSMGEGDWHVISPV